jgi:hypothetical protein
MKCAIVANDQIVNLILVDGDAELQKFAEAAGPGHTAEPLTAAQALTAWIGATRTADGWSELAPVVPTQEQAAELEAARLAAAENSAAANSELAATVERQTKELNELRAQVARITAGVSAFL